MPNEWDNYTIGDIVKFEGGAQPPRSEFISYPKEGYIRLIQIRDYKTNEYLTFIPLKKARKFCTEDDVMIGRYGPPIFQILRGIKGAYNVALMKAIPAEDKLHKDYLYYYLQNETLFILIDKLSRRSSGQTGIDIEALNQFPFPLPPKNEQERIINIIKTWDKAIELKEKLIEEKKKQKKGLMQKLLTGKVRLPEFDGEWKEVKLGNVIREISDKTTENNQYQVLTSSRQGIFLQEEYFKKSVASSNNIGYKIIKKGQFTYRTMSDDGSFKFNRLTEYEDGIVSPAYVVFEAIKINPVFLINLMDDYSFNQHIQKETQGGTRLSLKYNALKEFVIRIPSVDEQDSIANVLNTADKAIQLYQKELEALRLQKKGLMQLLLTGIVRVNTQEK
jgi:type I restriction enzyme S subunit